MYLHAVVDTSGGYAFGFLNTTKQPGVVAAVLHNDLLPFYKSKGLTINALSTDNGCEFCGKVTRPYEIYLAINDTVHHKTKMRTLQTNGFVERFNRTVVLEEFIRTAFRTKLYESVNALQKDLDKWFAHFNTERPHLGYQNMGLCPIEMIKFFLSNNIRKEV